MPPTERSIDMLLSFRMMSRSLGDDDTLFNPSKASPPLMAPSPITATTLGGVCCCLPATSAATAIPKAAEMELLAWPHMNVS